MNIKTKAKFVALLTCYEQAVKNNSPVVVYEGKEHATGFVKNTLELKQHKYRNEILNNRK